MRNSGLCNHNGDNDDKKYNHHVEVSTPQSSKTFWEQSCAQSRKKSWLWVSAHKYTWYVKWYIHVQYIVYIIYILHMGYGIHTVPYILSLNIPRVANDSEDQCVTVPKMLNDTDTFFRYQIFPIPIPALYSVPNFSDTGPRLFSGTKFCRYRFRDFFPVPICNDNGSETTKKN